MTTAVLLAAVALSGCGPDAGPRNEGHEGQPEDSPAHSTATAQTTVELDESAYDNWHPVYRDVRPATPFELRSLRQRIHRANASPYTAVIGSLGTEISSTPEHVRVRIFKGAQDEIELHLDPAHANLFDEPSPYVVCYPSEPACVRIGSNPDTKGAPHLFNNGIDTFVFMFMSAVAVQHSTSQDELAGKSVIASLDSPLGVLDCMVTGTERSLLTELEGQPVDMEPHPMVVGVDDFISPLCIDSRGLVVVSSNMLMPVAAYTSFQPGVQDQVDGYPAPIRNY